MFVNFRKLTLLDILLIERGGDIVPFAISNPNPKSSRVGDCVIRAISIATGKEWESVYAALAYYGYVLCDMPSSNAVWGKYLSDLGFKQYVVTDTCPDCYTIRDFCRDHPSGTFVLGTGAHAVAVLDGTYYDTWDSGDEIVSYYWRK